MRTRFEHRGDRRLSLSHAHTICNPMPKCLPLLLGRQTTLNAALDSVDDMLLELSYPAKQAVFFSYLREQRSSIEALVSFHLGLTTTEGCRMSETQQMDVRILQCLRPSRY